MPGQTDIELEFGDGSYLFALKLPQLLELQRVCGVGIFAIYGRVLKGRYLLNGQTFGAPHECEAFASDIYETIRLALIGGGQGMVGGEQVEVSPLRAKQLVETYAHTAPLAEPWGVAAVILSAKIEGYEPQKKKPGDTRASKAPEGIEAAQVMVDCAMMGADWRGLTLWQYQAMLSEWADRHSGEDKSRGPVDPDRADRLKRAMAAHSVH